MLRSLNIRDLAIIETLDLEFDGGFTVLTGETGAGKSILLDALVLALGGRADSDVVRTGAPRAEVTAEFDVTSLAAFSGWIAENGLEGDPGVCLVRRVVEAGGRSRSFINGRAVTLAQLREAGGQLVDIHGQHLYQSLARSDFQRELLDGYAGAAVLSGRVRDAFREWRRIADRRRAAEGDARTLTAERERLEWQVRELEALRLEPGEWERINAEHGRLANAAGLIEGVQAAIDTLSESDAACLSQLAAVRGSVADLARHDPGLATVVEGLDAALATLDDVVRTLRHQQDRLELDPGRLAEVERRLEAVHAAGRRFRIAPAELPDALAGLKSRLAELEGSLDVEALAVQEEAAAAAWRTAAAELGAARAKAARRLAREATAAMQGLAMEGGRVEIELSPVDEPSPHGSEAVEFLVSANKGMPVKPIARVASGGELSRLSLAIQTVTSQVAPVPTLVFDEVDAGIGGRVAEVVGRMLRDLAARYQVLCVTHLPQVAACGGQHWNVSKAERSGVVRSRVQVLDRDGRVDELARMLAGSRVTEAARRHAEEMLQGVAKGKAR